MAVADTITEINAIIDALKTQAEATTAWDATAKTALETRIVRLRNKASGATTLTDDLNDLATKATTPAPAPAPAGKIPICGLGFRLIGLKTP